MKRITKSDAVRELETFTDNVESVILSTVSKKGEPFASYSPFVEDKEGNFYVFISTAVPHSHNMFSTKKAHIMFLEDESKTEHIYARRRLYFSAECEKFEEDDVREEDILKLFKEKFRSRVSFFSSMKDSRIYKLKPSNGNIILGFGSAFKVNENRKEVSLSEREHSKSHEAGLAKYE